MSAFLKIDRCAGCRRELPWEWVPPVELHGRTLCGTGVWRSGLVDDLCEGCLGERDTAARKRTESRRKRERLIALLGGPKPFREFTFERFEVSSGNRAALDRSANFDPDTQNLLLYGPQGVGKTHLAYAIVRRCFWAGKSVVLTTPARLIRMLRMKPPEEEQRAIDSAVNASVLVLDAFGTGPDTPYTRHVLQEILDAREFRDRGGLVVTTRFSPSELIRLGRDVGVTDRLAGMCSVVEVRGANHRFRAAGHG